MDIIVTSRLTLRSPLPGDIHDLHDHVLSDPEVMRFAFSGKPLLLEQSRVFFDTNFDHDHSGKKLGILIERGSSRLVGFAGLISCNALGQNDYELGFILRQDAWGLGYATEIGLGQIEYALESLRLSRVLAQVSAHNHSSILTLSKIGMVFHSSVYSEGRGDRSIYIMNSPSREE